jgi:branched-chain amino acid transport system permease protein
MTFALSVVGGVYHWLGPIIAGLLMRAVPSLLSDFDVSGFLADIFFGAALLHALDHRAARRGGPAAAGASAALRRRLFSAGAAHDPRSATSASPSGASRPSTA